MKTAKEKVIYDVSLLTDMDMYLFKDGNHFRLYETLGSHLISVGGIQIAPGDVFRPYFANFQKYRRPGGFLRIFVQ